MKKLPGTELVIENMVAANCRPDATVREVFMYREALRALVRLAKSEQMLDMKKDAERSGTALAARASRRCTKDVLRAAASRQQQLAFVRQDQDD
jgi:hypothetical protein